MHPLRALALSAAALAALIPAACPGQDSPGGVALQFLSFPKAVDPAPLELLVGEGKTIEVEIPTNELSKAYRVPQLGAWVVGQTVDGPDGKPVFQEYGRARALTSPSQLILLVRKGAGYSDGFDVLPVDNRVGRFDGGKFLFMNAAKVDIAGEVGGEKFVVPPGRHIIVAPKAGPNGRTFHALFYFRGEDRAKPFFSSTWPLTRNARALVFFYHDPATKRLRLHTIRDFTE